MRQVTREEFHKAVLTLNVHPQIVGSWPYTSVFKTPTGEEKGRIEQFYPEGSGLTENRYFIA